MKPCLMAALLAALSLPALAADHNNLDAGRPLDFDDAESVALGEQALEIGASVTSIKNGGTAFGASAEYIYGFAADSHISLDFDPGYAKDSNGKQRFDSGDLGIGVFHNLNREYGNTPALAVRADLSLPTGRGSSGVDVRLRGIASRRLRQYDRVHINLDLTRNAGRAAGERRFEPGIILGYSRPLGYPTSFARTLVAQIGYRAHSQRGAGGITTLGLGLRQQVRVRGVLDVGLKADISGGPGRESLRLVAGYSHQF